MPNLNVFLEPPFVFLIVFRVGYGFTEVKFGNKFRLGLGLGLGLFLNLTSVKLCLTLNIILTLSLVKQIQAVGISLG